MEQNLDRAEAIIDSYGCDQSNLIAIMQDMPYLFVKSSVALNLS